MLSELCGSSQMGKAQANINTSISAVGALQCHETPLGKFKQDQDFTVGPCPKVVLGINEQDRKKARKWNLLPLRTHSSFFFLKYEEK